MEAIFKVVQSRAQTYKHIVQTVPASNSWSQQVEWEWIVSRDNCCGRTRYTSTNSFPAFLSPKITTRGWDDYFKRPLETNWHDIAQDCQQTAQYYPVCTIYFQDFENQTIYCTIFRYLIFQYIVKDRFGLVVSLSDYWSWGRGFDPRCFHKF